MATPKKATTKKTDTKKPAAKKPAMTPEEQKARRAQAKSAKAALDASLRVPPVGAVEPTTPEKMPPTDEQVAEALTYLSPTEIEFVEAYLTCYNGTKAWLAVHPNTSEHAASVSASRALDRASVRRYIAIRMKAMFERTEEAQDRLLQTYQQVAYGDVNELVQYRRESCRYCYGEDHKYQHTPAELERYIKKHIDDGLAGEYDPKGGVGFNPKREPHPDCPECHGEGKDKIFFKDTRYLSPAAKALYAGAKTGKDGIEIKTASQERAREMLAKILKLYDDKTEITVTLDADTLEEKFVSRMRAAHERMAAMMRDRGMTDED